MDGFDHLLDWKLKAGSHLFPGPDGGTCINEAALIVAGFKYQPVRYETEMPECFSRPICCLAMELNDQASDEDRQRLLPFVTRLTCADTPAIERQRADYILRHTSDCVRLPFDVGLKVLEGALAVGRQAGPLGPDEVQTRMNAARADRSKLLGAATPAPAPDKPLFSKVKGRLAMKESEPAM